MSRTTSSAAKADRSALSLANAVAHGPRPAGKAEAGARPARAGAVCSLIVAPPSPMPSPIHRGRPLLHPGLRDDPIILRVELEVADPLRHEVDMLRVEQRHR